MAAAALGGGRAQHAVQARAPPASGRLGRENQGGRRRGAVGDQWGLSAVLARGALQQEGSSAAPLLRPQERLVLVADEVYQTNIYALGKEFTSFKKVGWGGRGAGAAEWSTLIQCSGVDWSGGAGGNGSSAGGRPNSTVVSDI